MKICPKCGKENTDSETVCRYCGAKLEPTEKDFEWIRLITAKNQFESDVVKDLLEANGINVMVKRAAAGITGGFMLANPLMGSSGAWTIFVMKNDFNKANQILEAEEAENGTFQDNDAGNQGVPEEE